MNNLAQMQVINKLRHIERLLFDGRFVDVERIMTTIDTETVDVAVLVAIASITSHAKPHFTPGLREAFIERVEQRLIKDLGADRAKLLLEHRR